MTNIPAEHTKTTEVTVAFVKGALSAVPIVGGLLIEVGSLFFDPLKKREERWKRAISDVINQLIVQKGITIDHLKQNELFVSLVLQASTQARKTHQKEKIQALKNIVFNGALVTPAEEDLLFTFIEYIDELTPTHIAILKFMELLSSNSQKLKSYEHLYCQYIDYSRQAISRPHFKLCCDELGMRKLAHLIGMDDKFDDITGLASPANIDVGAHIIISDIGKRFLKYISTPAGLGTAEIFEEGPGMQNQPD